MITLAAAALAAVSQYLFKRHVKVFRIRISEIVAMLMGKYVIAGLGLYLIGLVIYIYALSMAPSISFVYPIFASVFVFVLLISKYALGEKMGMVRIAGILLIVLGIGMIAMTYG